MFLVLARTIKESLVNFWRNGWLSVAAVSVLIMSLYVVGMVFVMIMTADNVLKNVEERINVSVYFKADVAEDKIMEVKTDLENYSEIKSVEYVSKDQALVNFRICSIFSNCRFANILVSCPPFINVLRFC